MKRKTLKAIKLNYMEENMKKKQRKFPFNAKALRTSHEENW